MLSRARRSAFRVPMLSRRNWRMRNGVGTRCAVDAAPGRRFLLASVGCAAGRSSADCNNGAQEIPAPDAVRVVPVPRRRPGAPLLAGPAPDLEGADPEGGARE